MEKAEIAIIKKQLSIRNEDIEFARIQRLKRLEDENRLLLLSLDEANKQNREKQLKIIVLTNEGISLKSLMSDLQIKCTEAKTPKGTRLCECDPKMKELKEKCIKTEEELQSTSNQLAQIEDEYMKLQDQYQESKSAWEKEKMLLMNETSKLLENVNNNNNNNTNNNNEKHQSSSSNVDEVTTQREMVKKVEENLCNAHQMNGMKHKKRGEDNGNETKKAGLEEADMEKWKDMMDESSNYQVSLMEEVEELTAHLEKLDSELSDKTRIESELEYELQVWRSLAEYLAAQVDENMAMRKNLEKSLLAQAQVEETLRKQLEDKNDAKVDV